MSEREDRGGKGRKLPVAGQPDEVDRETSEPGGGPATDAAPPGDVPAGEAPTGGAPPADAARPPEIEQTEVPSSRLIFTLAVAGALAGLAIVVVFGWAQPRIEAHRAAALRAAIQEVLGGPERYETLFVVDGALVSGIPAGLDSTSLDRIYAGYGPDGQPMGFAIAGEKPGYQDIVGLIFGYDTESGELLGMKVLESKETPGLGDRIEKDSGFVSAFSGVVPPIEGVKAGAGTGDEHEVDMITGATISSRTVIDLINQRLESIAPMIREYEEENRNESGAAGSASDSLPASGSAAIEAGA